MAALASTSRGLLIPCGIVILLSGCTATDTRDDTQDLEGLDTFVPTEEPEVSIGGAEGEPAYLLSVVSDAARLSDGTIVVSNCMSAEIRYFDPAGRFLGALGGRGEGPGEFMFPGPIFHLGGDTVGVFDRLGGRITIVAPSREIVRTIPFRFSATSRDVLGHLANGLFVGTRLDSTPASVDPSSVFRTTVSLLLFNDKGVITDSMVGLPSRDRMAGTPPGVPVYPLRLGRKAVFAVEPEGIFYGGQDETGIIHLDASLQPVDTTITITRSAPITGEVRQAFQTMLDAGAHQPPEGITSVVAQEYAPMMPAFGYLVSGRDGRLWVEDPIRPGHHPLVWTAYEDGEPVARVEIPPRFFPFEFGRDWVLGVSFDELGIEHVEVWPMVPGNLPARVLPPRDAKPPNLPRCGAAASR